MATTALSLVNGVLRRLRKTQVSSFTDNYTGLILDFVNQTKEEIEDAWQWTFLRQTKQITTAGATADYAITGGGDKSIILGVWNETSKYQLRPMTDEYYSHFLYTDSIPDGSPYNYRVRGLDSNGDIKLSLFPTPEIVETIKVDIYIPEAELDSTTDETKLPKLPLILGAWALAISERGEDGGQNTSEQWMMYRNALSDRIAKDVSLVPWETTWVAF